MLLCQDQGAIVVPPEYAKLGDFLTLSERWLE